MLREAVERRARTHHDPLPFVPPDSIDSTLIHDLRKLFGEFQSFAFELETTGRFPMVLYPRPGSVQAVRSID